MPGSRKRWYHGEMSMALLFFISKVGFLGTVFLRIKGTLKLSCFSI